MLKATTDLWARRRLLRLTWEGFGCAVARVHRQISSSGFRPDLIVGLARGGLPLATALANSLAIPDIAVVSIQRNRVDRPRSIREAAAIKWSAPTLAEAASGAHVLVCDDIVGDGGTLAAIEELLQRQAVHTIRSAVAIKNSRGGANPDYFGATADEWVIFPWERLEAQSDLPISELHIFDDA